MMDVLLGWTFGEGTDGHHTQEGVGYLRWRAIQKRKRRLPHQMPPRRQDGPLASNIGNINSDRIRPAVVNAASAGCAVHKYTSPVAVLYMAPA
ncbi:MAG TPA: hypothetical protein ENK23_04010 [Sorangium sp.]|nr:hypothetical protein [Sorangium sp.]